MAESSPSSPSDDALITALRAWTSDERHRRAIATRMAATVHAQLSADESRFSGLLLDLAEGNAAAQVQLPNQRLLAGNVSAIGKDFIAVTVPGRDTTLLALSSIVAVAVDGAPRRVATPSSRAIDHLDMTIGDVLAEFAIDSMQVRFTLREEPQTRSGEVFAVSYDMCTIGLGVPPHQTLFVPLERFETLSLM